MNTNRFTTIDLTCNLQILPNIPLIFRTGGAQGRSVLKDRPPGIMLLLYKTFVRPILEYCCVLFEGLCQEAVLKQIQARGKKVMIVQRRMLDLDQPHSIPSHLYHLHNLERIQVMGKKMVRMLGKTSDLAHCLPKHLCHVYNLHQNSLTLNLLMSPMFYHHLLT